MNIELSDEPEIVPLTPAHLFGPLVLHALILVLAGFVWLAELFFGLIQRRKHITNLVMKGGEIEPNEPKSFTRVRKPIPYENKLYIQ